MFSFRNAALGSLFRWLKGRKAEGQKGGRGQSGSRGLGCKKANGKPLEAGSW